MGRHIPPFDDWPEEVRRWIESLGKGAGDTLRLNKSWILDPHELGNEFKRIRRREGGSKGSATRELARTYRKGARQIRRILCTLGLRGLGSQ